MLRILFLIFFLCGLTIVLISLGYRASAETSTCSPRGLCVPVKPPDCVKPDCDVTRPLLRVSCAHAWRERLIGDVIRSPQSLYVVFERDKLNTVAMVSTLDILRAMGR